MPPARAAPQAAEAIVVSALEHARDRWGAAEVVDARSPAPLVSLLREFAALHADAAAGKLDDLLAGSLRPSVDGWYVCPLCGRRGDREGARGTARRWCTGSAVTGTHGPAEMRVQR